jgi:hypothetical protein
LLSAGGDGSCEATKKSVTRDNSFYIHAILTQLAASPRCTDASLASCTIPSPQELVLAASRAIPDPSYHLSLREAEAFLNTTRICSQYRGK